ncbi:hypothetical protein RB595_007838 [Gaeumannomyces hyphopodioides]
MPPSGPTVGGSSRSFKPKASEIAHETRRTIIPLIRSKYADRWKTYSYYYQQPMSQITLPPPEYLVEPTPFAVFVGDPVNYALHWMEAQSPSTRVALVCAANEKRAGGDWVTGVAGYEERLCRRSTLSATLETPGPGSPTPDAFPMSTAGGIFSENVVVFRTEKDRSEPLDEELWRDLPVCSVPPVRWPKVNINAGWLQYSFADERIMMRDKIMGALAICLANGIANIVVGDFGLGNGYRNPPYETAAMWNEAVNGDPAIRGRIHNIAFIFEDGCQSTQRLILDDLAKKQRRGGGSLTPFLAAALAEEPLSDFELFRQYFVPSQ